MGIKDYFMKRNNTNPFSTVNLSQKQLYEALQNYYDNNNLYNSVQVLSYQQGQWVEAIKPLKTCVNRSVEFYVSRLCQNEMTVTAKTDKIAESIEQFMKWSNISSQKRLMVRSLALFGDLFLKVVSTKSKVYTETIDPRYVTNFETDYRGYIQEIRIDIPMVDEDNQSYTYTEYWNKEYFSAWNHHLTDSAPLDQLGEPTMFMFLSQLGIDFVPVVWIPFKQVAGKERGESCVNHALLKIDEVNRITTRLHQLLWRYNKPVFAVSANAVDKNNRPIPPPSIKGASSGSEHDLDLMANEIIYLPGMSNLESLIPNINYDSALNIIKSMEEELEKDLPELRYNSLKEKDMSGKAIKSLLAPAIDKAKEAQDNLTEGLQRLNEMALTIGEWLGLFTGIGTYENGDFEHSIDMGDLFPTDIDERATSLKTLTDAGIPLESAMKIVGFEEEIIQEAGEAKKANEEKALGTFLSNFNER